jgi:GTP cyclohydrolase II
VRAASVLGAAPLPHLNTDDGLVALRLAPDLLSPAALLSLADPTVEQVLPSRPEPADELPAGATAAIALAKLARLLPAVLVGRLRRGGAEVAAARKLLTVEAADVHAYPQASAAGLRRVAEASVPLDGAPDARIIAFRAPDSGIEHLAIMVGRPDRLADRLADRVADRPAGSAGLSVAAPLVRVHSECFTGDLLGSLRCDCGQQLHGAIARMAQEGAGVLLYLSQEGRGIGLVNKLRAYALQDRGLDTVDANHALGWAADERNFMIAAMMLEALGLRSVRLLTNNPDKVAALTACGVNVVRREAHVIAPNGVNDGYLGTKARRFGHYLG